VLYFNNLMDYMALISILFISPFFAIFLLGMLWKRPSATAGFYGMLGGLAAALAQYVLYRVGVLHFASPMAANLWSAVWGLGGGLIVMITMTLLTPAPAPASLVGLVYDSSAVRVPEATKSLWYQSTAFYAAIVVVIFIALNVAFF
jgi:SSS family solute:Na+ symporter